VVGASAEDRGFAVEARAGAVHELLADARTLLPVLDEYLLEGVASGLRPGTPDNGPVVGPTGIDGLVMATGHYRNGILLCFVTADEVVRLVRGDVADDSPFAPFRPDRFAGARTAGVR
jgi:glycine oxidase